MGVMEYINSLLGRDPETVTTLAPPRKEYPTPEDAQFAQKHDYAYGSPYAPYFNDEQHRVLKGDWNAEPLDFRNVQGKNYKYSDTGGTLQDQMRGYYARAALASQGSGLAALGFDPSKTVADPWRAGAKVNISGEYDPKYDQMYANVDYPSSIVHESIHRGIQKLKDSPFWKPEFDRIKNNRNEEATRYIMRSLMGDPEAAEGGKEGLRQREAGRFWFEDALGSHWNKKLLDEMDMAASQYLAAKRPMGPR